MQDTCEQRIDPYMQSRAESLAELYRVIDTDQPAEIDGYETDSDSAREQVDTFALSIEQVLHVKITFGTGGPADWLDAEIDAEGAVRSLRYHFADWFDHAARDVEKDSPLWRYAEGVAELVAYTED